MRGANEIVDGGLDALGDVVGIEQFAVQRVVAFGLIEAERRDRRLIERRRERLRDQLAALKADLETRVGAPARLLFRLLFPLPLLFCVFRTFWSTCGGAGGTGGVLLCSSLWL